MACVGRAMGQTAWLLSALALACGGGRQPAAEPRGMPVSASETARTPVVTPCVLPAEVGIALRDGRVLLNGADVEALAAETPPPSALFRALAACADEHHHYAFELDPSASADTTRTLLDEVPTHGARVEKLAFAGSAPIAVRLAAPARVTGHWVKLSIEPHQIVGRELRRPASQPKTEPTVANERRFAQLADAYAWLRSTCGKDPCASLILALSSEQPNSVIAAALRALSAPTAPPPLLALQNSSDPESDEPQPIARLEPAVIQRVVRESYEFFKLCYQGGLARDPNLQGAVSTRFLIARNGSVRESSLASSTLPDAEVVQCIVKSFTMLHFPKPNGGTVTVVYPIMLSPG